MTDRAVGRAKRRAELHKALDAMLDEWAAYGQARREPMSGPQQLRHHRLLDKTGGRFHRLLIEAQQWELLP